MYATNVDMTGEIQLNKDDLDVVLSIIVETEMKNEMQVMRRTCGYIGSNMWGKGRTARNWTKSFTFIRLEVII